MSSNDLLLKKGLSGWLRKRPRFAAGYWPNRFVQLTEDGKVVIYSRDPSIAKDSELIVALSTIHVPKNIIISEPAERLVRTKRNGTKTERVIAIRVRFKDHVLFTFGANTMEEAKKWKQAIEFASKMTLAPDDILSRESEEVLHQQEENNTTSLKPSKGLRSSMIPEGWKENENWKVVEVRDGVEIEGHSSTAFPSLRARVQVNGTREEIFRLVLDDSKRSTWDEGVEKSEVLKILNEQSAIVYLQLKEIWVGPVYTGPRDLVMLRYWRKDEDTGDFVITWQSLEDVSLAPPVPNHTRGKIFSMSILVTSGSEPKSTCLVRIACHADPGGTMSFMPSSVLTKWLTPFVTRILGLQKALEDKTTRKSIPLQKDGEEDDEKPLPTRPVLMRAESNGIKEKLTMKIGSWNPEEWLQTPEDEPYMVRGKKYLEDRIKIKTGKHMFHIVAADLNRTDKPEPHCAARSDSPLKFIQDTFPDRQVLIFQFIMPGPPFHILAVYGVSRLGCLEEDTPFSRMWNDFVEGTDDYRNSVFKLIPRVIKGPYVVKKTVGETPAMLGQKVKLHYFTGPNYIEVDVDLNTSAVAGSILSIFKGYATTVSCDLACLLEGHSEDELPEEILMGFRMVKPHLAKAKYLGADPDPIETKRRSEIAKRGRNGEAKKTGEMIY